MGHHNHFVFIGDARVRQLYKSFVSQFMIDGKASDLTELPENSDLGFNDGQLKLNVQFLWRPRLDDSLITDLRNWMVTCTHYIVNKYVRRECSQRNNRNNSKIYISLML